MGPVRYDMGCAIKEVRVSEWKGAMRQLRV